MGKGKSKSSSNGGVMSGMGGIAGSGIFGHVGVGTTIQCPAGDESLYCKFMKFMNFLFMAISLCVILYVLYIFLRGAFSKGRK
jgi:hypothetical protein